jgi:hypothetical protein
MIVSTAVAAGTVVTVPAFAASGSSSLTSEINSLHVVKQSHSSTYERGAFGSYDRPEILAKDYKTHKGCNGYYSQYDNDCYTAAEYGSKKKAAHQLDIEEIVSRKEAWVSGAYAWSTSKRHSFTSYATNRENLTPVTSSLNRSKGAENVTEFVPPYKPDRCHFITATADVKSHFGLSVTKKEKTALLTDAKKYCHTTSGVGHAGGGGSSSGPAAVSWSRGRLDVFVRGGNGQVDHKSYSAGRWHGWSDLGGRVRGAPAVASWVSGRLDVFATGASGKLYHKFYRRGSGWSAWHNIN